MPSSFNFVIPMTEAQARHTVSAIEILSDTEWTDWSVRAGDDGTIEADAVFAAEVRTAPAAPLAFAIFKAVREVMPESDGYDNLDGHTQCFFELWDSAVGAEHEWGIRVATEPDEYGHVDVTARVVSCIVTSHDLPPVGFQWASWPDGPGYPECDDTAAPFRGGAVYCAAGVEPQIRNTLSVLREFEEQHFPWHEPDEHSSTAPLG